MNRTLARALLLLLLIFVHGCSAPQPAAHPDITAHPHRALAGHTEAIVELAFSRDSNLLATGGDDSAVKLRRVPEGQLAHTLTGGSEHVYAVAFSPDGRWLATSGYDRAVRLWRLESQPAAR